MTSYNWGFTGFASVEDAAREILKVSKEECRKISEMRIFKNGDHYDCLWNFGLTESDFNKLRDKKNLYEKEKDIWKSERDRLLKMTEMLDEHPEGYEGPCLCKMCKSYVSWVREE